MQVEAGTRTVGWLNVHPSRWDQFENCNLHSARDFLNLTGVVVSGHIGRNVSRVRIGDEVCYLKREHRVRWRDRWRNLLDGFGPCSMSKREADVLTRLEKIGPLGPRGLASGESGGEAFLLVEEAQDAVDLRKLPAIDGELAAEIGRVIAEIHNAGIDQPDLFAKHFLVNQETGRITILDWQRASICKQVPLRNRVQTLAALRATCSEEKFSTATWQILLNAYQLFAQEPGSQTKVRHTAEEFERSIREDAFRLSKRASIRRHLAPVAADQELVRINGEMVCAIPEVASELELSDVIASLYDPANVGRKYRFRNGREGVLSVARYRFPSQKWWAKLRGKHWRSSKLRLARLLFHLERHGIRGPKLLAYGQHANGSFCLSEPLECRAVRSTDRTAVESLLHRLHEANCSLTGNPFGMGGPDAVVADPQGLRLNRSVSNSIKDRDHERLNALLGACR